MKFRNKETGEVFYTITGAWTAFMCPGPCGDCNLQRGSTCEKEWIEAHPHEAARLMGYEVVEDEKRLVEHQDKETGDLYYTVEKEDNMDKPRICEVLGIEPEERFSVGQYEYWFDQCGNMWCKAGTEEKMACGGVLCNIINHPDCIIRKPRFTKQEVEDAKYIKRILMVDLVSRNQYGNGLVAKRADGSVSVVVNSEMFPSIRPGQSYTLDEIIGGEE